MSAIEMFEQIYIANTFYNVKLYSNKP